jgi:hypothetical protein
MVQVAPIWAHLVQPVGASAAAKALDVPSASAAAIIVLRSIFGLLTSMSIVFLMLRQRK